VQVGRYDTQDTGQNAGQTTDLCSTR
jgi:hypothetical protein